MVAAIEQGRPKVDGREAREHAVLELHAQALFDGRYEFAWDRTADRFVDELKA